LKEICGRFDCEVTEELMQTRDCSSFVGNIIRNLATMYDKQWTLEILQSEIDEINRVNGY
jgi:hypothetical protein